MTKWVNKASADYCERIGARCAGVVWHGDESGYRYYVFAPMPRRQAYVNAHCPSGPWYSGPGAYFEDAPRIRVFRGGVLITQRFGWDV